jgi:ribonuclease Z
MSARDGDGPRWKRGSVTFRHHSSVEQAAATAARAGVGTLVMTHYVPALIPGQEEQWRALAASEFGGRIELGDDLHRVVADAAP